MSKIKSFSVGNGDMFYIVHNSDNFSIIDCSLPPDDSFRNYMKRYNILRKIRQITRRKSNVHFISTHPDQDHIQGLKELDDEIGISNFYCVKNNATKEVKTDDFMYYRALRNNAIDLYRGCERDPNYYKKLPQGISILWPILENKYYRHALQKASKGESSNNISPIIKYRLRDDFTAIWMGDLETDFMKNIIDEIVLPETNILFAPHHGRDSGKVPNKWLDKMKPDIIVIGEAESAHLNYYSGYHTLTQNSAGDITFICDAGRIHVCVEKGSYRDKVDFLRYLSRCDSRYSTSDAYYIGTLIY